ncbi:MAG: four-carbon acid sugar kinase family protein [Caldilineaceae bacterium]
MIVADDVTGAADSAARCRQAGLSAQIDLVAETAPRTGKLAADVVAFSTDSRFLPPQSAAAQVRRLVTTLVADYPATAIQWYKKIDSTLRGNIGSELAAMLPLVTPIGNRAHAIICPAFPAQARTLVGGYLAYAQLPPQTVHLPTLLRAQCDLTVGTLPLSTIRAGADAVCGALQELHSKGITLIVADGESEADLASLCEGASTTLPHALFCGSAGLVGVLAALVAKQAKNVSSAAQPQSIGTGFNAKPNDRPLLSVVGSGSIMAQRQLAYLRNKGAALMLELDPAQSRDAIRESVQARIVNVLAQPDVEQPSAIVVHLPPPTVDVQLEGAQARQSAALLTEAAAIVIEAMALTASPPIRLLVVGGDTAVHLLHRLGVGRLWVREEILPGMPLTEGNDQQGTTFQIILKAGNHGDEGTLATLLDRVQAM